MFLPDKLNSSVQRCSWILWLLHQVRDNLPNNLGTKSLVRALLQGVPRANKDILWCSIPTHQLQRCVSIGVYNETLVRRFWCTVCALQDETPLADLLPRAVKKGEVGGRDVFGFVRLLFVFGFLRAPKSFRGIGSRSLQWVQWCIDVEPPA